jgi:hypothetical protein
MQYKNDGKMDLLHRIVNRTDAAGFQFWVETYLEDHAETMTRSDRAVIEKATLLLGKLFLDSAGLEDALGAEAAAHMAARRVNVQQEIELRELRKRVEVLERKNADLLAWLHSGELRVDDEVDHETRPAGE